MTDINRNTNANTAQIIIATVTSSAGDSEILTLSETSTNTGIFTTCLNTTTNAGAIPNDGTLTAPVGSILTVSYIDPTDASDSTSATANIQPLPGVPGVVMNKTILSPSGGQVGVGQPVTYNLQVVNVGSTTLPSLKITDTFSSSKLSYVSASATPDVIGASALTWNNLGALSPGQSTNITVTFTTLATGTATNSATANGSTATNSSSVTLAVNSAAVNVVKVLLAPTNQPVSIQSNVVFRITVQNVGNTAINYLPIQDNYSGAYYQYVSATIPANGSGFGSLIWTNLASSTLATNATITNDITMKVVGQGSPANNTATVDFATDIFGNPVPTTSSTIGVTTSSSGINGHVYNDINQSGIFTNGDTGLANVTLQLYTDPNGDGNPADGTLVQVTTTDGSGYYELLNLTLGKYVVVETDLPGYSSSAPVNNRLSLNLTNLVTFTNNNFFEYIPAPSVYSTFSGTVFNDVLGTGTNTSQFGLASVTIDVVQDVNSNSIADLGEPVVSSTVTDTNGTYSLAGITPGRYVIRETDNYGYYSTGDSQPPNNNQIALVTTNGIVVTNNYFFDRLSPIANADTNSALLQIPITIFPLTNDVSPNGDPLVITNITVTGGTAVINPGSTNLTFTPTNLGLATIIYTIVDARGGTNSAIISINVTDLADLAVGKAASSSVLAGRNLTYTISVTNFGPTAASSVTVTDTLPASVSFVSASGNGVNNSGVVTWNLGTLAVNAVSNVTVTVTAPAFGSLTNTASVGSPTSDPNPTNNLTPPVVTTVTPQADLSLTKTGPANVNAASNLTYTIAYTNAGSSDASSVIVTDTLPATVSFVSASNSGTNNSGVVTWNLGALTNGQSGSVTVTVTAPASGSLTNVAGVNSPTGDPNLTNNVTPPVVTSVSPVADLGLGKIGPATVVYGSNFTYTIAVTNFGPSTATGILVTDSLPANVTFVSAIPTATTNASNQVVWTNITSLVSGATTNLTLTVAPKSTGSISNTASVGSPVSDPAPTNNTTPPVVTTVTPGQPVVTWPNPVSIVYGTVLGTNQNNATASVPGAFVYSPTNGVVLPVGTNTLSVVFTPTDTNYATTNLTVPLVVTPALLTVTANSTNKVYGAANPAFTANITGFVNGENSSVLSGTPSLTSVATTNSPVGPYTITAANGTLSAANYVFSFVNGTLTVNKTVLTVTANSTNKVYGAANPTFTASYSGFVNGDTSSVLSGAPSLTSTATTNSGVGSYTITATNGTLTAANYSFSFVSGSLAVNAATLTIAANSTNKVYGAANPGFTYTPSGFVNGDSSLVLSGSPSFTTTATTNSGVGSYPVSVTNGTLSAANYVFSFVGGSLTVNAVTLTVTANSTSRPYGTTNPVFTASYSGFVNGETTNVLSGAPSLTTLATTNSPAGNYPIVATNGTLSAANYVFSFVNGTLNVFSGNYGISWTTPASIVYGTLLGTNQNNALATVPGSYVYNPTNGTLLPAGTNTLNVVFTPTDTNYPGTNASVQLVVTPAPLSITASNLVKNYGTPLTLGSGQTAFAASGLVNGETVGSVTLTSAGTPTNAPAGPYAIVPSAATGGTFNPANYTLSYNNGTLTVNKVLLTVTASSTNKIYGATNPTFTASYSGFVNGENGSAISGTPSLTTTATTNSPVGPYTITATNGTLSAANYNFTFVNGTLTIGQATLSVTANSTNKVYGAANPTFTASYSGFVNGDTATALTGSPSLTSTATTNSGVGNYTITATNGTLSAANYGFSFVNGTLTVNAATLTVTANNATRAFGQTNPIFSGTLTGIVNGDNITASYATTATTNSPAGPYPIIPTLVDPNGRLVNYTLNATNGTLTVTNLILPVADIAILKSGPTNGVAGSNLTYTITVTNLGPATATNVVVNDRLPAGFTFVSAVPATATVVSNLVTWPGFSLANGAKSNFTVTAISADGGRFTNIAFGSTGTFDPNPTNSDGTSTNSQSVTTVSALADVAIFKTGSTNIFAGATVTYTIVATNFGPSTATNVVVKDNLPGNVTFQSATGGYSLSNGVITWPSMVLAKGATTSFTVIVTAPSSGSFTNIAFSTSGTTDPNPTNNNGTAGGAKVRTTISPAADVIVLLAGPTNVSVGDSFTYTITLTNGGPSTASAVVLKDNFPTSLTFISATGGGVFSNNVITWPTIGSLTNGGTTNFTFTVSAPGLGQFTNIAFASASTFDPNPTNNDGSQTFSQAKTIVASAQFGVLAGTAVLNPQTGLFEETVIVTNIGTATVAGVRLYVGGLRTGVTLYNATGTTNGTPYVQYNSPVNPSNTVTFVLEFYNTNRLAFTHTLTAVAILPPNTAVAGTNGVSITKSFMDTRIVGDTRFVIEFNTTPGKTYTVIYSDDMANWKVATPFVTANANITQWYDDGAPKTESKPTSVSSRYYRVIKN